MDENRVGLGYQDFEEVRTEHIFYIDKTDFIREWWENADKVTLITRPRRFGKTLNMSTVECFFSNRYAGRSDLFEGLSIWKEEKYRKLQGTFPVINLSFANVKAVNCAGMKYQVTEVISDLYARNRYLLEGDLLDHNEREYYENVKCGMEDTAAAGAVHRMAAFMQRYYGKKDFKAEYFFGSEQSEGGNHHFQSLRCIFRVYGGGSVCRIGCRRIW